MANHSRFTIQDSRLGGHLLRGPALSSFRPRGDTIPNDPNVFPVHAFFRFYGALNDFLPAQRRRATLRYGFSSRASVKDMIEALGVLHPEIERLVVNGEFVDFHYLVSDGDRVVAYPTFHALDLGDAGRLSPQRPGALRFIADVHLGRLAAYLRLAGFDTDYRNDYTDPALAQLSAIEDRVLLTRDVELLKRAIVTRGCYVRNTQPGRQLVEVLRRFDGVAAAQPFTRCPRCNGFLQRVDKADVIDRIPPRTRDCHDLFSQCTACAAAYWPGSHYGRIQRFLTVAFSSASRLAQGK